MGLVFVDDRTVVEADSDRKISGEGEDPMVDPPDLFQDGFTPPQHSPDL